MPPPACKEEEEGLQEHAEQDHAEDLPLVPQLFDSRRQAEDGFNYKFKICRIYRVGIHLHYLQY